MAYFYSPETKGFYVEGIHTSMPTDVFSVSDEEYQTLFEGQAQGKSIVYKGRKLRLEESNNSPEVTWDRVRAVREKLLANSDWTQLPDNQLSETMRGKWQVYRQSLRDITEAFASPNDVVWPMAPSAEEK